MLVVGDLLSLFLHNLKNEIGIAEILSSFLKNVQSDIPRFSNQRAGMNAKRTCTSILSQ